MGKYINAEIAIALGWRDVAPAASGEWFGVPPKSQDGNYQRIPEYSTDTTIAIALMQQQKLAIVPDGDDWVCAKFTDSYTDDPGYLDVQAGIIDGYLEFTGVSPTIAGAICLSAIALYKAGKL